MAAGLVVVTLISSKPCTPYTLHPTPYTLHSTPFTLHPAPYTTPYTLHPTPYTLHLVQGLLEFKDTHRRRSMRRSIGHY